MTRLVSLELCLVLLSLQDGFTSWTESSSCQSLVGPVLACASCNVCIVKDVKGGQACCVRKIISEHKHLFYLTYQSQSNDEISKPSQKYSDLPLQGYQALGCTGQLSVSAFFPTICSSSAKASQLHAGVPWAAHSRHGWVFKTVPLAVRSAWIYFLSHHNSHAHSAICSSRVFHLAVRNQFWISITCTNSLFVWVLESIFFFLSATKEPRVKT